MSGPIGYVDTPAAEALAGTAIRITGWALDTRQIDRVEVRIGSQIHVARYGLPRPDVAAVNPGYPDADDCGFVFEADLAPLRPERHRVAVVAVSRGGTETLLASKSLIPLEAGKSWAGATRDASRK